MTERTTAKQTRGGVRRPENNTRTTEVHLESGADDHRHTRQTGPDAYLSVLQDLVADIGADRAAFIAGHDIEQIGGNRWTQCEKSWLAEFREALCLKAIRMMLLECQGQLWIKAREIVLEAGGSYIKLGMTGAEIEGAPLTQINCGNSAPAIERVKAGRPPKKRRRNRKDA